MKIIKMRKKVCENFEEKKICEKHTHTHTSITIVNP